jgi:hypothetical protein
MSHYIGKYCKTCDVCLWTKAQKRLPMGELNLLPIPEGRWDVASVYFIVELPESQGHDTIMVVVDSVRKRAHFIETHTMVTALRAAWLYLQCVWKLHGLPWIMISNHGPQFVTQVIGERGEGLYEGQSDVTLGDHSCRTQPQRTGVKDAGYGRPVRAKLHQRVGPQLRWLRRRWRSRVALNRSGSPT